jgi:hypothetical protein
MRVIPLIKAKVLFTTDQFINSKRELHENYRQNRCSVPLCFKK